MALDPQAQAEKCRAAAERAWGEAAVAATAAVRKSLEDVARQYEELARAWDAMPRRDMPALANGEGSPTASKG